MNIFFIHDILSRYLTNKSDVTYVGIQYISPLIKRINKNETKNEKQMFLNCQLRNRSRVG